MSIRALVDNKFIRRYLIIGLGGLAFMAWGAYDAFVTGPFRMEMSRAFEEIKEEPDYEDKWLALYEKNEDRGWTRSKPTEKPGTIQGFLYFNYFVAAAGALLGIFFLLKFLKTRGTWMESTEDGITTSWGKSLKFDQITKINKKKWSKKGIAKVHFTDESGAEQQMVFDDFKYDRSNMSELMSMCEKGLKRDQIIDGKTEAEIAVDKAEEEKKKAAEKAAEEAEEAEA